MPVFNKMVYNWIEYILWWWGNIWEPLNLTVTASWLDATITWEDNEIWTIPPTTFQRSELVRKIGSAPTSPSDWTLVVTETVKDTYKTTWYVDQWLTDWETYYYRVFSYSDLGGISYCEAVSITASSSWQPWANTVLYYSFNNDTATTVYDWVSNNDWTWVWSNWQYIALAQWKYADFTQATNQYITIPTSLAYPTTDLTISFWIKYTSTAAMWIFHKWNGSDGTNAYVIIHTTNGTIRADIPYKQWDIRYTNALMNDGSWHHIACTKNGNSYIMYVDAQQTSIVSSSQSIDWGSATQWNIWRHQESWELLDWWLDEFIVENVAWSSQEVSDYYDLTKWDYWIS